ncbi:MarR family transcriptional regulator [Proteiniborus sp. MB09-C3]|uniref:MarR family winged helix-turn-helix transcriptional regulator n=1 Tax=Proteiniborus sp. MB09-C3 TaxID=3050072 RepID=UPI0025548849|nr:MarR family transcriptional regulator [Proteiniborus sp. MB09-C3]WIV13793.1 MarR family transcriptional regulator [Proteiniborus sp. MB09-C3]
MDVSDFRNIIMDYTRQITDSLGNILSPLCDQYGLTMLQLRILMELYQYGSHTVGSLANNMKVAGANISPMCKRLESKRLLERIRDQEDERVVKIALTKMGKDMVLEIDKELNEKFSQQINNETEEAFEDIILGLEKLNTLLQKINQTENK